MEDKFHIDAKGALTSTEGPSPLAGRAGTYRLQTTSPDMLLFVRSPAQGGVHEKRPRVVLGGDVGTFGLQDLIAFLGQARWSGVLRVLGTSGERMLALKDGEVRSAASDSPSDRIGEVMIRMGYVNRPQLDQVLNEAPPSRVGKAMVERGFLRSHDLYKCLNEQVSEIFHNMMLTREGSFVLIDQELDERTLVHNLSISMQGLLMDSIRKIDELAQFRKRIPNGKLYVSKKKSSDGKLEPEEDTLLALVDGTKTVLDLGRAAKVSEFDATRILYRLLEGGYVAMLQQPHVAVATYPAPPKPDSAQGAAPGAAPVSRPSKANWSPGLDEKKIVNVFNFIFREVRNEVARHGNLDMFLTSANAALRGSGVSASRLLTGMSFQNDGALDEEHILKEYNQLKKEGNMGSEPLMSLKQALSDVMFFLLFQAGELLESRADEDLARRVKELLQTIETK